MSETCHQCSTEGACPFSFTDESENAQNLGCLPSPYDILSMRVHYNKTWACHSNPTKPCLGALKYLKNAGLPYAVVDKELLDLESPWDEYINVHGSIPDIKRQSNENN